jgi:hypothetical protein
MGNVKSVRPSIPHLAEREQASKGSRENWGNVNARCRQIIKTQGRNPGSNLKVLMVVARHDEIERNMEGRRERREFSRFVFPAGARARSQAIVCSDGAQGMYENRHVSHAAQSMRANL